MPTIVNTHEAKSRLSELIRLAESGEEVIVARNGVFVARLVPWSSLVPVREPGGWEGQVIYHQDIDAVDDEMADLFDGIEDTAPW
jgi:prevent-host-death family protein